MSKTVTYVLIGGAVLVVGYFAMKKLTESAAPKPAPSPLQSIISGASQIVKNLDGFSYRSTSSSTSTSRAALAYDLGDSINSSYGGMSPS